jgi:glycosyltransferase involved in cell wall biosynthesis
MRATPLVSVIITTYDRADFLVDAIASVLRQSYTHYELLVADDGSTDDTAARLADYGPAVRHLRLEHSGRPSVARNRALAVASGELVAFLDDDDLWGPAKLQRQFELLARDPALGFVYSDLCFLYVDGTFSPPVLKPRQKRHGAILTPLIGDCFIHTSTVMVRRAVLDRAGWFDETFATAEDYDVWLRLACAAPAGFLPEPLVMVRRHPGEISFARELETYQNTICALGRLKSHTCLNLYQRARLRCARARMYAHLGMARLDRGERATGRRHLFQSVLLNPLQRRAWLVLLRSYFSQQR